MNCNLLYLSLPRDLTCMVDTYFNLNESIWVRYSWLRFDEYYKLLSSNIDRSLLDPLMPLSEFIRVLHQCQNKLTSFQCTCWWGCRHIIIDDGLITRGPYFKQHGIQLYLTLSTSCRTFRLIGGTDLIVDVDVNRIFDNYTRTKIDIEQAKMQQLLNIYVWTKVERNKHFYKKKFWKNKQNKHKR